MKCTSSTAPRGLGSAPTAFGASAAALGLLLATGCGSSSGGSDANKVPARIQMANTNVSATVECAEEKGCKRATVFVSACSAANPDECYEIQPAEEKDGNTHIIALDEDEYAADLRARATVLGGGSGGGDTTGSTGDTTGSTGAGEDSDAGVGGGDGEPAGEEPDEPGGEVVQGSSCTLPDQSAKGLPVDLLFVIDTTGSMASAIMGVVESIDTFVNKLAKQGVDMRIGGIAFGDAAPLPGCPEGVQPYRTFTDNFGKGTADDMDSFNFWLGGLMASYCGDGGGDGPENALDAIQFATGHDPEPDDSFMSSAFKWTKGALRVAVVITDVNQHQESDGSGFAHFDIDEVSRDLTGVVVTHVVGPNFKCFGTPYANCACDTTSGACDAGCACDALCPVAGCAEDESLSCDDPESTCDLDCPGYKGSACDLSVGVCDFAEGSTTEPCADDYDCRDGATAGSYVVRRCVPTSQDPYADVGDLALATRGAFTPLPGDGRVDLTKLPLTGILVRTSQCDVELPEETAGLRVVYQDDDGNAGEVTVPVQQ